MEYLQLVNITKTDLAVLELCLEYSIDIKHRTLYLSEEIDSAITDNIIKGFHFLDQKEGTIYLQINSPGGICSDMRAIYDTIRACNNPVHTLGIGQVCSAAGLLLVAGDKRIVTENCWFMAHEGQADTDIESNITILARAQIHEKQADHWAGLMAEHTKPSKDWWIKKAIENKKELWLTAKQMHSSKYGMVDELWGEGEK
jgi:ATP-dependent Clp endopeptidase proteolytic subunit ClpP